MNNKGITYFRLNSPYAGDITKNCALDGYEVDNNFFFLENKGYTLEGKDIKSVYVEDNAIKIELVNGDVISSDSVFDGFTQGLTFDFDTEQGVLTINYNGVEQKIEGFITCDNIPDTPDDPGCHCCPLTKVATNDSIKGNGKVTSPLYVSPILRAGEFSPVKQYLPLDTDGDGGSGTPQGLPDKNNVVPGDRYVVQVENSDYGLLYNYRGVTKIACDLIDANSEWRIPTKEDWDDMLNAIEPHEEDRNHSDMSSNIYLGRFAGKLLKSVDLWKPEPENECDNSNCNCDENDECNPTYCGDYHDCHHCKHNHSGIDEFGFKAVPAGVADDERNYGYFSERGEYWTTTVSRSMGSAYIKRFDYNKSKVYQDIVPTSMYASIRLVKEYDGNNYLEREEILGDTYSTVLVPSLEKGNRVWTSINVALSNCHYHGIQPNGGEGITMVKRYYIYEWDGTKWLTNELREGESVVILDAPNGRYASPYRVINGELVDVEQRIADDVVEVIQPTLDNLETLINNEVERATNAETELSNRIDTTNQRLDDEISERQTVDTELREAIETERGERVAKDEELEAAITTLNTNLEEEIAAREAKDTELEERIAAEEVARANADEVLDGKITQEIADRIEGDEELQEALTNETEERVAKDEELEGKILTEDGTEFDRETGILTLKSNGGTNDITVQFSFNFGQI